MSRTRALTMTITLTAAEYQALQFACDYAETFCEDEAGSPKWDATHRALTSAWDKLNAAWHSRNDRLARPIVDTEESSR